MNLGRRRIIFSIVHVIIVAGMISVFAFAANRNFTGIVGDAMCGMQHIMPGGAVPCTKGCVSKGSKYALLIGDSVYRLETTDKTVLATLDQRAGKKVTVTGIEKDNTITVSSVR